VITVYSKANCPFCDQAKSLLEARGVAYEEVRIDTDMDARAFVVNQGHRSVPQIYKDGQIFVEGGFQGLQKLTPEQLVEMAGA
jgi:glutaredoxin 3